MLIAMSYLSQLFACDYKFFWKVRIIYACQLFLVLFNVYKNFKNSPQETVILNKRNQMFE